MQESLLPGTDAIMNPTLEWTMYHGKHLVRYKNARGVVYRCLTPFHMVANSAFQEWYEDLKLKAREAKADASR